MADTLRIKRRQTGSPGAPSSLANAELAYNEVDHVLYYGEGGSVTATSVVAIAGQGLASNTNPLMNGTVAIGTASTWARADHVHASDTSRAPTANPTFTGTVTVASLTATGTVTGAGFTALVAPYAPLASPSFTGTVTIGGTITGAGMTAWSAAPGPIGSTTASTGAFTNLSATGTVSGAGFTALLAPYALASSVPAASSTTPVMDGTAAIGVGTTYARADHVHPSDTSRAPLASPVFTGNPTGPTPTTADSSVSLATTAFVKNQAYAPLASPAFTGTPTAPTAGNGTNNTQIATTQFVLATRIDQLAAPGADVAWNSRKITGLADPTNAQDGATKNYVDTAIQGLNAVPACLVATAGSNITLSGTQTIDGIAVVAGNRVLVKDQTTAATNGIYVVAAGAWTRSLDMDTWAEVPASFTFIEQGTVNADTGWLCTSDPGGTLGTTAITWVQFSSAGTISAGNGLTKVGNTLSVVGTANRIAVGASVDIDANYVGQASITTLGSVATGTWNATTITVARGGTGATTLTGYISGNGTGAFTASASIPSTAITGLGTMSTQNANAVAITGGTIDAVTFDCGTF